MSLPKKALFLALLLSACQRSGPPAPVVRGYDTSGVEATSATTKTFFKPAPSLPQKQDIEVVHIKDEGAPLKLEKADAGSYEKDDLQVVHLEGEETHVIPHEEPFVAPAPKEEEPALHEAEIESDIPTPSHKPSRKASHEPMPFKKADPVVVESHDMSSYALPEQESAPSRAPVTQESLIKEEPIVFEEHTPSIPSKTAIAPVGVATKADVFSWPLEGKVLRGFAPGSGQGRNDGLNIEGQIGDPVKAARGGQVVYVGNELHGFGNLVLVKHDEEWMTAYAHLSHVNVQRGDTLSQGQILGQVGKSGNVGSPQLHFEIRHHSQPVDPKGYLK